MARSWVSQLGEEGCMLSEKVGTEPPHLVPCHRLSIRLQQKDGEKTLTFNKVLLFKLLHLNAPVHFQMRVVLWQRVTWGILVCDSDLNKSRGAHYYFTQAAKKSSSSERTSMNNRSCVWFMNPAHSNTGHNLYFGFYGDRKYINMNYCYMQLTES